MGRVRAISRGETVPLLWSACGPRLLGVVVLGRQGLAELTPLHPSSPSAAAQRALADVEGAPPIFCVQHPSPANPAVRATAGGAVTHLPFTSPRAQANRGWAEAVERQLADAGVDVASWARQSGGDSGRKRARPDGDGDDSGEEGIAQPRKVGAGE